MNVKKIIIELADGRQMNAELYPDLAPISVANFENLIDLKYFDGLIFHRVIPGFMIQGGGMFPDMKEKGGLTPIKGEFSINGWTGNTTLKHGPGVLSMARTMVNDSATSQFFLVTGDASFLDGQYASFGKISDDESLQIALSIEKVETTTKGMHDDVPVTPVVIKTIKLA